MIFDFLIKMKKFLLIALIILIQSKTLNTFQEDELRETLDYGFIKKIRNDLEIKALVYNGEDPIYDVLDVGTDSEIDAKLRSDYPVLVNLVKKHLDDEMKAKLDSFTVDQAICILSKGNVKDKTLNILDYFYSSKYNLVGMTLKLTDLNNHAKPYYNVCGINVE